MPEIRGEKAKSNSWRERDEDTPTKIIHELYDTSQSSDWCYPG